MNIQPQTTIAAVVTMNQSSLKCGSAAIFIVDNKDSLQKISSRLEKILDASAHEIDEQTMIIVSR